MQINVDVNSLMGVAVRSGISASTLQIEFTVDDDDELVTGFNLKQDDDVVVIGFDELDNIIYLLQELKNAMIDNNRRLQELAKQDFEKDEQES